MLPHISADATRSEHSGPSHGELAVTPLAVALLLAEAI